MPESPAKKASIVRFMIIFVLVYAVTQFAMRAFLPERFEKHTPEQTGVVLAPLDATVKGEHSVKLRVSNFTDKALPLKDRCPMPPVDVWSVDEKNVRTQLVASETAIPCVPLLEIPAGVTMELDLSPWKYTLFSEYGTYEVELPVPKDFFVPTPGESQYREGVIARFTIYEPGVMTQLFRTFVTKPLVNLFIFIASLLPGHSLGWTVIIVTIVVKLLLFFPTQHAMEGQRKMEAIQPKMDEIRKRYKDDPKKQQEETLKIWKENKVNPMQSCLPMLVQFPILIGLFFTIRDGSVLALSKHLLYPMYANIPWSFNTNFYGLDLLQPEIIFMPIGLVLLQFFQMRLSFAISKKKKAKREADKPKVEEKKRLSQQEIQQRVMMYALPLMIGFFAIQFPAAVSLYWGISTIFGIGQQLIVNRKELR